jgi:hypothetical protein
MSSISMHIYIYAIDAIYVMIYVIRCAWPEVTPIPSPFRRLRWAQWTSRTWPGAMPLWRAKGPGGPLGHRWQQGQPAVGCKMLGICWDHWPKLTQTPGFLFHVFFVQGKPGEICARSLAPKAMTRLVERDNMVFFWLFAWKLNRVDEKLFLINVCLAVLDVPPVAVFGRRILEYPFCNGCWWCSL